MLTPTICRMKVEAPRLAAAAKPGQFLIVRADEKGERIPLTISDYDAEEGTVTIVTQGIGASTLAINEMEPGESFADVAGPLGNPSDFCDMDAQELASQRYVFIAGGVGTAPVYPQVKWLHAHGIPVDVIIGAGPAHLHRRNRLRLRQSLPLHRRRLPGLPRSRHRTAGSARG